MGHFSKMFLSDEFHPRCKKCKGEKTVKEKGRQEIFIEKGMTDHQRIVLPGAGDQEVDCSILALRLLTAYSRVFLQGTLSS